LTRTAADIGRGLAPARAAHPIAPDERIHIVGAGGAGASAAALLAFHAGANVSGCDTGGPSPYTAALDALGIPVAWEHSALHVAGASRLAVTKALTSVHPDHPELVEARRLGIALEPWQQIVADAAATSGQVLIAVAGTHGKSTTTGWIVDMLVRAGRDPSAFVGALLEPRLTGAEQPATARWGSGPEFVVEADEYAGNFDPYQPAIAVLLNAEWDHPDVFADEDAVLDAFAAWIRRSPHSTLVANTADRGVARVVERLEQWEGTVVAAPEAIPAGWDVGLPGSANADNARSVIGVGRLLGVDEAVLKESVASYPGVGRRFEVKAEIAGVVVIDDYGHHPTAIARTLEAVRSRYPNRRVWAVYEPLTFHRTAQLLPRFAEVLATADEVAIADIWAGRDPDTTITSASALAQAVTAAGGPMATAPGSVELTADYLAEHVAPSDVVLVMGGGRSYVIASRLVELLRGREA
jgi:UDP-N-acetylmuramate--alanine ligase